MSRVMSKPARRAPSGPAPHAVATGFRPRAAAAAVAAAFSLQPLLLQAQPTGAQVIHGQASFSRNGNNLLVTTRNGAGTGHSAINWQSFSIPAGSTTRFLQPSASSTSINRVVGSDPSAIYGTLSSNGRIVLVNPAGITVGRGAVVDTAGFTASTLAMSEADAVAGRLLFEGGAGGALQADGHIIARSGDIVLIAPDVQTGTTATVQADGTAILAAGRKVALTGRGLEGIQMEVQAGNAARNLGKLQGDAVGVFAGTLRHSGLIEARAVSSSGGKVVLKATGGDALVSGAITAKAGDKGGNIDVLGQRVALLAGANLDASGAAGGGQVRIGGDYQGRNASVPNAARTYVDAAARINADATVRGDGGRVIVWADEVTGMHGQISARGGTLGGNGGFTEVSGKQSLQFTGGVDLRAPKGTTGSLLLDPNDIIIEVLGPTDTTQGSVFSGGPSLSRIRESDLENALATSSVIVATNGGTGGTGRITIATGVDLAWSTSSNLGLQADKDIDLQGSISAGATAAVSLQALGGGVVQNASTSRVKVGSLLINAQNGGVTMDGANEVDTLAAATAGAGNNFTFTNAKALTIGTVSTPYGVARSGIDTVDTAGNEGSIRVQTTSGALTIAADIDGKDVTLKGAAVNATSGANIYASGNMAISGTSGASKINMAPAYLWAGGNLGFSNAGDVVLGTVDAAKLTAKLSGSLVQDSSWSSGIWVGGVAADVKGSINLGGGVETYNSLGYVSGTAGGNIVMSGVQGVAPAGLSAGGDIKLAGGEPPRFQALATSTSMSFSGLDVIGNVTAGGTATLASDMGVIVQDSSTVTASAIALETPQTLVYGTLQPGGAGGIGSVTASGGVMFAGSGTMQLDVASLSSFDTLKAVDDIVSDASTGIKVVDLTGGQLSGSFSPVSGGSGSALSFFLPTSWSVTTATPYVISAVAAPPPPVVGDPGAEQQVLGEVVTFASLFVAESERQEEEQDIGKDDIVFTDTACRPQ